MGRVINGLSRTVYSPFNVYFISIVNYFFLKEEVFWVDGYKRVGESHLTYLTRLLNRLKGSCLD